MSAEYVTAQDVANRFRALSADEMQTAAVMCHDAGVLLRSRVNIDPLLAIVPPATTPRVDPDLVRLVLANVVIRALQSVGNVKTEATGPFSITYGTIGATLGLTDADVMMILRTPGQVGAVGAITMTPGLTAIPPTRRRGGYLVGAESHADNWSDVDAEINAESNVIGYYPSGGTLTDPASVGP